MMKKSLRRSILLCLLLLCVMIPVMAQRAAALDYDLWVNGVRVTDENCGDIPFGGTGKASYDDSTKTLTFENAVLLKADFPAVQAGDDLIITGRLQYTGTKGGILANKSLTIDGSDTSIDVAAPNAISARTLTVEKGIVKVDGGIETYGDITINGGDVTATGSQYGIHAAPDATGAPNDIIINGGTVKATESEDCTPGVEYKNAIWASGSVVINGGKADATAAGQYGYAIFAETGDIVITGGTVNAVFTAFDGTGLRAEAGDITITGSAAEVNALCKADVGWCGINTPDGSVFISGGSKVTCEGPAYGIYAIGSGDKIEITGDGTVLTIRNSLGYSIIGQGAALLVKNAELKISRTDEESGSAVVTAPDMVFDHAKVTVDAPYCTIGIMGGDITVADSAVEVTAKAYGIEADSLTISGEDTVVKAKGGTKAISAGSGAITIDPLLVIRKPTDGTLGTDQKQVYESDGTTPATIAEIGKKIPEYDLWVGGVQVNSLNKDDILGDGTGSAKFDPETNTLTLKDPKITAVNEPSKTIILSGIELTIKGTAVLEHSDAKIGLAAAKKLTVDGDITVKGSSTGIHCMGGLVVESGAVLAESDNDAIYVESGDLFIKGGDVTAKGDIGIEARGGGIEISGTDTKVTAEGTSLGIESHHNILITGGNVSAKGNGGILSLDGNIEISGTGTKVTAEGTSLGIESHHHILITGGNVTAKGAIGLSAYTDLTISGADTVVTANGKGVGINALSGKLEISGGAEVNAEAALAAVAMKDINISDSTVTAAAAGESSVGIHSANGSINISGADTLVTADGTKSAIIAENGTITIDAPLGVFEPNSGEDRIKDGSAQIYESDLETAATHVVIKSCTYYDLWVGSIQANSENKDDILGDGTGSAKFDPDTKTLKLDNPKITAVNEPSKSIILSAITDLTIKGSAVLEHSDAQLGIAAMKGLTIDGDITVKISNAGFYGIHVRDGLVIEGGTVLAETDANGIFVESGDIFIKGGDVTAKGKTGIEARMGGIEISGTGTKVKAEASEEGISAGLIRITGGDVTAKDGDVGLFAWDKDITISGENTVVTADGKKAAIEAESGKIEISGRAQVTATATGEDGKGIEAGNNITISDDAKVTATATGEYSQGIHARKDITISGGTVQAKGNEHAIIAWNGEGTEGSITISDAVVEAIVEDDNGFSALSAAKDISIMNAEVLASCGYEGIDARYGDLTIQNSKVTSISRKTVYYPSIFVGEGDFTVSNSELIVEGINEGIALRKGSFDISDSKVTVTLNGESDESSAIWVRDGDISISGESTVVKANGNEYAIDAAKGTITIDSPLVILEPVGGKVKDKYSGETIYDGGTVATHVLIAKGYVVTWKNEDGTVLQSYAVGAGETPVYTGATPTKAAAGGKTYTFKGWTPDVVPVTADATYTATHDESSEGGSGGILVIDPETGEPVIGGTASLIDPATGEVLDTWTPDGTPHPLPGSLPPGEYTIHVVLPDGTTIDMTIVVGDDGTVSIVGPDGELIPVAPGEVIPVDGSGSGSGIDTLPFKDVTPDSPYVDDIQYVYDNGIMNGMSATEFSEELPLTRGMIVTVLWRMEGLPDAPYTGTFTDVKAGKWFTDGVEWAASHGIVLGYGNGLYGPNDQVTREQLAAILNRYAVYKGYKILTGELSAADADRVSRWATENVKWAAFTGVLEKDEADMLRPREPATRGEIAHAIHVFLEDVAK